MKIGYEINFNRYFYKPKPMRTLEEVRADVLVLENETDGLLDEILGRRTIHPAVPDTTAESRLKQGET